MENQISISKRPVDLDVANIEFSKAQCIGNSFSVAKQNLDVQIVEGFVLSIDGKEGKAMAHAWNIKNNIHFDLTAEEVWSDRNLYSETMQHTYFVTKIHDFNIQFEFSDETNKNVDDINKVIGKNEPIE